MPITCRSHSLYAITNRPQLMCLSTVRPPLTAMPASHNRGGPLTHPVTQLPSHKHDTHLPEHLQILLWRGKVSQSVARFLQEPCQGSALIICRRDLHRGQAGLSEAGAAKVANSKAREQQV